MLGLSVALACLLNAASAALASEASAVETVSQPQWQARGAKNSPAPRAVTRGSVAPKSIARGDDTNSLPWRAPGTRATAPVATAPLPTEEPAPAKPVTAADSADGSSATAERVALPRDAHVRKAMDVQPRSTDASSASQQPSSRRLRRMPVVASRSKTRDAVMRVSNEEPSTLDDLKDPFENESDQDPARRTEEADAPVRPQDDPSAGTEPTFRNDTDPFPETQMPDPLPEEPEPSTPEPSGASRSPEPYTLDPSVPGPDPTIPDIESPATLNAERSCDEEKRECLQAIEELRGRDIKKIFVGLQISGENGQPAIEGRDFPCECALGLRTSFQGRDWAPTTFTWRATSHCHKPLYFEDVALERYGHSWNPVLQPFMSAAHFYVSVPLLPYKMGLTPPNECMYTLGYYRPGNCAPYMLDPIPLSLRAGVTQALGVTGFVFWFWPPVSGLGAAAAVQ